MPSFEWGDIRPLLLARAMAYLVPSIQYSPQPFPFPAQPTKTTGITISPFRHILNFELIDF